MTTSFTMGHRNDGRVMGTNLIPPIGENYPEEHSNSTMRECLDFMAKDASLIQKVMKESDVAPDIKTQLTGGIRDTSNSSMDIGLLFSKYIQDIQLDDQWFAGSAERIDELWNIQDLEDGEKPLTLESVNGFRAFITKFNQLGEPVLGLFPQGTLSAGWRVSDNKHLLIEFLDSESISFAMIGPDNAAPDNKFYLNGRAARNKVLNMLSENGVDGW